MKPRACDRGNGWSHSTGTSTVDHGEWLQVGFRCSLSNEGSIHKHPLQKLNYTDTRQEHQRSPGAMDTKVTMNQKFLFCFFSSFIVNAFPKPTHKLKEDKDKYRIIPRFSRRLNLPREIHNTQGHLHRLPRLICWHSHWYRLSPAGYLIQNDTVITGGN
jgi:hypothetical protein